MTNFTKDTVRDFASNSEDFVNIKELIRKSELPDPVLIFSLGMPILTWAGLLFNNTVDKLTEKLANELSDDCVKIYRAIRKTALSLLNKAMPPYKVPTLILHSCDIIDQRKVELEFVIRTKDVAILEKALSSITNCNEQINQYSTIFFANKIQFIYNSAEDKWHFNFLLTNTGDVIGSERAWNNARRLLLRHQGHDCSLDRDKDCPCGSGLKYDECCNSRSV